MAGRVARQRTRKRTVCVFGRLGRPPAVLAAALFAWSAAGQAQGVAACSVQWSLNLSGQWVCNGTVTHVNLVQLRADQAAARSALERRLETRIAAIPSSVATSTTPAVPASLPSVNAAAAAYGAGFALVVGPWLIGLLVWVAVRGLEFFR